MIIIAIIIIIIASARVPKKAYRKGSKPFGSPCFREEFQAMGVAIVHKHYNPFQPLTPYKTVEITHISTCTYR
jgi:hypothetical protein